MLRVQGLWYDWPSGVKYLHGHQLPQLQKMLIQTLHHAICQSGRQTLLMNNLCHADLKPRALPHLVWHVKGAGLHLWFVLAQLVILTRFR